MRSRRASPPLRPPLRYSDDFGGVPLAYAGERVLDTAAVVHPYFPLARLRVAAELTVFRPREGARVTGVVSKVSDGYVGLLVLGFMNAAVRASRARPDLRPAPGGGAWASARDGAHRLAPGDAVTFDVAALERDGPYAALVGSLEAADTGNAAYLAAQAARRGGRRAAGGAGGGAAPPGAAAANPPAADPPAADPPAAERPLAAAEPPVEGDARRRAEKRARREEKKRRVDAAAAPPPSAAHADDAAAAAKKRRRKDAPRA